MRVENNLSKKREKEKSINLTILLNRSFIVYVYFNVALNFTSMFFLFSLSLSLPASSTRYGVLASEARRESGWRSGVSALYPTFAERKPRCALPPPE